MDKNPAIRIGDPERNDALNQLSEVFANGYIDVHEFDQRMGQVIHATTRGELAEIFADLPETSAKQHEERSSLSMDAELDRIEEKGKLVKRADGIIWAVVMITFFLGLFVFEWSFFWLVFPVGALASWGVRAMYGLGDDEEEVFEELEKQQKKDRADRLKIAMERRKELGQ